jgi:hypothetical protein
VALTVADVRQHVTTALLDPALQRLIDAAYEAIVGRIGPTGADTEVHRAGSGPLLMLNRAAASITSVTEDATGAPVVLNALDYALRPSGSLLERLDTGPNPASRWRGRVDVVAVPLADAAERDRVVIALVKLDVTHNPGVTSERIGDWEESFADNSAMNYDLEREAILDSMLLDPVGVY